MMMSAKKESRMLAIAKSKPEGRDALRHAQSSLAAARDDLTAARAATDRARDLVEEITRQLEDIAADDKRVLWAAQDRLKAALRSGASPGDFVEERRSAGGDVAARLEAARLVVADFKAEESACEQALSDARAAVEQAIQDVVRAEVETIAARWAEVELEARALRIKLGREGDPVWRMAGESDAGLRATGHNFQDSEFDFRERQITSGPWKEFSAALLEDADTRLDFTAADRAVEEIRKERAERRAANERFVENLRRGVAA
jgi:hypothetical protein